MIHVPDLLVWVQISDIDDWNANKYILIELNDLAVLHTLVLVKI